MSYQVLARKWRPKAFSEVIGQQHVLQALINALNNNRLHHAYLFSGTRGVGKTTLARIFAKSLNCDLGVTSTPCGVCGPCVAIDEGRFVDLLEVDAASRTKVEDTRELLENVQYAPSQGRYKVYLIDEVHMLSNHSFNALLKTLEEPPEHVKFLLATTDPHKLPVTVLSRCLQLNLMNMTPANIVGHLGDILSQEQVTYTPEALWQLARAADGSMRDALSLTDQAIAYTDGALTDNAVNAMLGGLDRGQILSILQCLTDRDATALLAHIDEAARFSPDFHQMLTELMATLHRVAIAQISPAALENNFGDKAEILEIARRNTAEDIQLFYQIGMLARRDLPHAPDARSGFEMALLRMMVFSPEPTEGSLPPMPGTGGDAVSSAADSTTTAPVAPSVVASAVVPEPAVVQTQAPQAVIETPVAAEIPVIAASPVIAESPIVADTPVAAETSVVAETPVVADTPLVAETPVVADAAQVADTPPMAETSVVVQDSAIGNDQQPPMAAAPEMTPPWDVGADTLVRSQQTPDPIASGQDVELSDPTTDNNDTAFLNLFESMDSVAADEALATEVAVDVEAVEAAVAVAEAVDDTAVMDTAVVETPVTMMSLTEADWAQQFWTIGLDGMTESIFGNACWQSYESGNLNLLVDQDYEALFSDSHREKLLAKLQSIDAQLKRVGVLFGTPEKETPFMLRARVREEQRTEAVSLLQADPFVRQLESTFGARLDESSVKPRLHQ